MQNKSEEIWMYIKFPKLSLEAITMNYSKDFTNKPLVVIDTHKNKRKIIAYNNVSKDYGIDKTLNSFLSCYEIKNYIWLTYIFQILAK